MEQPQQTKEQHDKPPGRPQENQVKQRREDRQLYVPPPRSQAARKITNFSSSSEAPSANRRPNVEFLGRFGRIGNYEFEYDKKEDAAVAAAASKRYGGIPEGLLVQHVEKPVEGQRKLQRGVLQPKTMRADIFDEHVPTAPRRRLLDNIELLLPRDKRDTYRWRGNGRRVGANPQCSVNGKLKKTDQNKEQQKEVEQEEQCSSINSPPSPSVSPSTFEHEMFARYPDALSRRLLSATWIGLFYSQIKNLQGKLDDSSLSTKALEPIVLLWNEAIEASLLYFKNLLNMTTEWMEKQERRNEKLRGNHLRPRISAEARHFQCHLYVILGDVCRYRDRQITQQVNRSLKEGACTEDQAAEKIAGLFSQTDAWYKRAQRYYPQEGHTYSQWYYLSLYTHDPLGRVFHILRSILCAFKCRNEDLLTIELAKASLPGDSNNNKPADITNVSSKASTPLTPTLYPEYTYTFLLLIQSLYSKIRLDQFQTNLSKFSGFLRNATSSSFTAECLKLHMQIVCISILMMLEASGLVHNQIITGDSITATVNGIKLGLSRVTKGKEGEKQIQEALAVEDSNYDNSTRVHITYSYAKITDQFCNLFLDEHVNLLNLIMSNERFRFSVTLLVRITSELLEGAQSPISPLWAILLVALYWMATIGLFSIPFQEAPQSGLTTSLFNSILELRKKLNTTLQGFTEELFATDELRNALLQYKLPEDDWLQGLLPIPLHFCTATAIESTLAAVYVCPIFDSTNLHHHDNFCRHDAVPAYPENDFITKTEKRSISLGPAPQQDVTSNDNDDCSLDNIPSTTDTHSESHSVVEKISESQPSRLRTASSSDVVTRNAFLSRGEKDEEEEEEEEEEERHCHISSSKDVSCCSTKISLSLIRLARLLVLDVSLFSLEEQEEEEEEEEEDTEATLQEQQQPSNVMHKSSPFSKIQSTTPIKTSNHTGGLIQVRLPIVSNQGCVKSSRRPRPRLVNKRISFNRKTIKTPSVATEYIDSSINNNSDITTSIIKNDDQTQQREKGSTEPLPHQLILIDGCSVGRWHKTPSAGSTKRHFSVEGIQIATEHYLEKGCEVMVFVPDYIAEGKDLKTVQVLTELDKQALLTTTPPQDSNLAYLIHHAQNQEACIVSNNSYKDIVIEQQKLRSLGGKDNEVQRTFFRPSAKWFRSHVISFMFVGDEFLPNPDFIFPESALPIEDEVTDSKMLK